jgi:hypothetical protein
LQEEPGLTNVVFDAAMEQVYFTAMSTNSRYRLTIKQGLPLVVLLDGPGAASVAS